MKKHLLFLLVIGITLLLSSCISNKNTVLFQDGAFRYDAPVAMDNKAPLYKIQPNDVLSIKVKDLNPQNTQYLNAMPDGIFNINEVGVYLYGYSVSDSGFIYLPDIGKIQVLGLTVNQARERIQEKVRDKAFVNATVFVTLVSYRISIIGEVSKPGYYYVYNNSVNLLEALALAGDFKEFADRKNIHLIRNVKGGSEVIKVDLTDPEIFKSPYYYLLPNDILYAPNMEVKNNRSNLSNLQLVSVIFSGAAVTLTAINIANQIRISKQE
ncbi:MAG: polysaccharide biosynthesis/export family protein [Bacteroidia bacterium]|nr:polysaccharide biosynthesis/export family protein [Bacteroidia bacterium]